MNLAAVWKLPVIFVVENNRWVIDTGRGSHRCGGHCLRRAGYGMRGEVVDGNEVLAVCDVVARARQAGGPSLIEAKTFRMRGHEEAFSSARGDAQCGLGLPRGFVVQL